MQCKFMLQTPVLLAELWLDAWSCLEMGSAKFDRVELADEGVLVLLIICVVSQGKCYFLFSSNTVCSARTVHQIPALVSSYSRCLKRRSQIPPQIPPQNCPLPKQGAASRCQGAVGTPHTHRGWVCFSGAAALTHLAAVPRHPVLPLPAPQIWVLQEVVGGEHPPRSVPSPGTPAHRQSQHFTAHPGLWWLCELRGAPADGSACSRSGAEVLCAL